ncbi:MAG: formylmethanofuran dehydrogenase [Desulfobacca sp.]|nr:formylmethanofuran dehydrogenase [Desulfobacca sp.]
MNTVPINPEIIDQTVAFHGHWCPGLAIGIRVAQWVLEEMGKASDEEIVAVVETDMCGVDAIQFLTGCTFGKGNLIHQDFGKNAFSFYRRRDNKSARLVARPDIYGEDGLKLREFFRKMQEGSLSEAEEKTCQEIRERISRRIMGVDFNTLFEIKPPPDPVPRKARILNSLICASCNEPVMETRTRRFQEQNLCIPCFEVAERRY